MNLLFMSMGNVKNIEDRSLYSDLLRKFRDYGHSIYIAYPSDKNHTTVHNNVHYLSVRITGYQSNNRVSKALSMLLIQNAFCRALNKHYAEVSFDLIMYSTPPISFYKPVRFIKKRDRAITYLILKDIFPQNAIDINLLCKHGLKGLIYRYFRMMEKKLYHISDKIGCMSPANVQYVLKHNPSIPENKVELCPNSIDPIDLSCEDIEKSTIRQKNGLPLDKIVFVYGGNLGKPQGIDFLIKCLQKQDVKDAFFLIIGNGTEYGKIKRFIEQEKPDNVRLLQTLPKRDYDRIISACDVGMIFLDYRFTIPNFPSRLLPYMQAKLPVFAVTDPNTDIGKIADENGFGFMAPSDNDDAFLQMVKGIIKLNHETLSLMGERAYAYLLDHYTVEKCYQIIMRSYENCNK